MSELIENTENSNTMRLVDVEDITTIDINKVKLVRKSKLMNFVCKKTLVGRLLHSICERKYRNEIKKIIDYLIDKRLKEKREDRLTNEIYKCMNICSEKIEFNEDIIDFQTEAKKYIESKTDLSEEDKQDIINMIQWNTYCENEYIFFNEDLNYFKSITKYD